MTSFDNNDFKIHKWKIKEWNTTYYIDIPQDTKLNWTFWNGTAKGLDIFFSDSSIIHAIVDPPTFDTINRDYSPTKLLINYNNLPYKKIDSLAKSIEIGDTTILYGPLDNGNFWKEKCYPRTKVCYLNISKEKIHLFDESINSFRQKRHK